MLKSYTKEFYRPERMVLAGVGIDHQILVNLGKKYFSMPKSETKMMDTQAIEANKAIWTGGAVTVSCNVFFFNVISHSLDKLIDILYLFLGRT